MATTTFEAFQATRVEVDDLAHATNNIAPEWFEDEHGTVRKAAGFIYGGDCYIERRTDGRYLLVLGCDMTVDADLETLERKLYQWAVDECLFESWSPAESHPAADPTEATLCRELADYCTQHGLPLQSADELVHALDEDGLAKHGAWLAHYIDRWEAWEDRQHAHAR